MGDASHCRVLAILRHAADTLNDAGARLDHAASPARPGETMARRHSGLRGHQRGRDNGIYFKNGKVTDGSHASGDLDSVRQWLLVNRQFLAQNGSPSSQ
jgi:hypothetical protein